MCLITEQKKPITLDEPLIVYEVVRVKNDKTTPHFQLSELIYECGKSYETEFGKGNTGLPVDPIAKGVYGKFITDGRTYPPTFNNEVVVISEGFHFCKTIERAKDMIVSAPIGKFEIPKGAEVYFDKTDLGVTNKIKFIELLMEDKS